MAVACTAAVMAPAPPPSTGPDFESAHYDAQTSSSHAGALHGSSEDVLSLLNVLLADSSVLARSAEDAVESCLVACLDAVLMQYPAREDDPVSAVSTQNCSWEAEQPPEPCAADSWLRGALPDAAPTASTSTSAGSQSWAMQQFLANSAPAVAARQPSLRRTSSRRSQPGLPDDLAFPPTNMRHASVGSQSSNGRALNPTASRVTRSREAYTTKLETSKVLTPEQEHMEEQLRQELMQRKQQEELRGRLQQKDAEERAKLATLRKELKGKDYTYDHKGEVVILNEFDPDRTPLESLSGPAFKVAGPEDPARQMSPKRRNSQRTRAHSASGGSDSAGTPRSNPLGGAPTAAATLSPTEMRKERERRLATDYRKAPPKTQPSAMDTLTPVGGVTLRQGAATKSGPLKAQQQGLTREAYQKQVARKAREEREERARAGSVLDGPMAATAQSAMGPGLLRGAHSMVSGSGQASSAQAIVAAARAQIQEELSRDPLAAYEGMTNALKDAQPRREPVDAKPPTPDMNLVLTGAGDWGMGGRGRGFEPAPSLPATKPTERQLTETVGRTARLPRERVALATLAPPISPIKAGVHKDTGRLQFTSVLSK